MKKVFAILLLTSVCTALDLPAQSRLPQEAPKSTRKAEVIPPTTAWTLGEPFGIRHEAVVDTIYENYSLEFSPATVTPAWVATGNYGCQGETLIYFNRLPASDFFFRDPLSHWLPSQDTWKFYNSRIPMTLVSYNFGGGKETGQDRLGVDFSGNINPRAQVGAKLDYLYSKGSFNYQAMKDLTWGFDGSYIGERYQFQGFFYHYNLVNKENGGITDELYITDPAEIQGGSTKVDFKTIPTFLDDSHNRTVGSNLVLNNRYSLGTTKETIVQGSEGDSIAYEFVPVTTFSWNFDYKQARHTFRNDNALQDAEYWKNRFLTLNGTEDKTTYFSVRNTLGVELREGFNKYAQAGIAVFLTHEYRRYNQPADTMQYISPLPEGYSPIEFDNREARHNQNLAWVGAQLSRRNGHFINYTATAEIGLLGDAAGEVKVNGVADANIPLFGDTVRVEAYGRFTNESLPYLLQHYVGNHFAWDNDFSKTRRIRFGGSLTIPQTSTRIEIGAENVNNLVYFNSEAMPAQHGKGVQVFSATLTQRLSKGIWNWDNTIIYQKSSDETVIPLPQLAVNSNMYIKFRIARALNVQFGADCNYYTRYRALAYEPSTSVFYNANDSKVGNYPYVNLYINMKLSKTRFYVMMTHVNQGWFGNDWFAMRNYPMNPRRLQMGLSIDFAN